MEDRNGMGEELLLLLLLLFERTVRGLPHPVGGPLRRRLGRDSRVPQTFDDSTGTPLGADPRRPSRRCVREPPNPCG